MSNLTVLDPASVQQRVLSILWALQQLPGLSARTLVPLIRKAGSVTALWDAPKAWFLEQPKLGLTSKQLDALLACRLQPLPEIPDIYAQSGIEVIAIEGDPRYPAMLKECYDPPLFLFVKGNPDVLSGKTIAVVGTRSITPYGRQVTEKIVSDWQGSGVSVISGLAAGVDGCAHKTAIQNNLPTVAVFGCGLDTIFPSQHKALASDIVASGGALVSEYPLGTPPNKFTFPQRNRIVAGMSHGVVVVEGPMKSGALITARLALEEGRSVFSVPGNIFSPNSQGPLSLIRSGAIPILNGQDVLQELQWLSGKPRQEQTEAASLPLDKFTDLEQQVLQWIPADPYPVENLQQQVNLPAAQLNEVLTGLELEGVIVTLPGGKVCRA